VLFSFDVRELHTPRDVSCKFAWKKLSESLKVSFDHSALSHLVGIGGATL
jgi:hypothetical protein